MKRRSFLKFNELAQMNEAERVDRVLQMRDGKLVHIYESRAEILAVGRGE